jgi:hypothetical protein
VTHLISHVQFFNRLKKLQRLLLVKKVKTKEKYNVIKYLLQNNNKILFTFKTRYDLKTIEKYYSKRWKNIIKSHKMLNNFIICQIPYKNDNI